MQVQWRVFLFVGYCRKLFLLWETVTEGYDVQSSCVGWWWCKFESRVFDFIYTCKQSSSGRYIVHLNASSSGGYFVCVGSLLPLRFVWVGFLLRSIYSLLTQVQTKFSFTRVPSMHSTTGQVCCTVLRHPFGVFQHHLSKWLNDVLISDVRLQDSIASRGYTTRCVFITTLCIIRRTCICMCICTCIILYHDVYSM